MSDLVHTLLKCPPAIHVLNQDLKAASPFCPNTILWYIFMHAILDLTIPRAGANPGFDEEGRVRVDTAHKIFRPRPQTLENGDDG